MIFNSSFVRWCIYCDSIAIICVSARFCALASISFFFAIIEREIFVQQNDKITQTHYEYFVLHFSVEFIFWFSAGQKKIPRFNLCNFSHHCNEEIKHTFLDTFTFFFLSLVCAVAKHQMGFL